MARASPATQVEEMSVTSHKERGSAFRPVLTFVSLVSFCGQPYSCRCCLRVRGLLATKRHKTPSAGFARNPSSKSGHKNSVVIHAGTHVAEKFMAERPQFVFCIFLPLIFLPDLTSAIRRLRIFAREQEFNC